MTTPEYLRSTVIPAAYGLLPEPMRSTQATALLLAIALQESGATSRAQAGGGPARGFWQFEQRGGIRAVMWHPASRQHVATLATLLQYRLDEHTLCAALEHHDVLAAAFARLLLWTDASPLPLRSEPADGWRLYLKTWRPGHPRSETWDAYWARAWALVDAAA